MPQREPRIAQKHVPPFGLLDPPLHIAFAQTKGYRIPAVLPLGSMAILKPPELDVLIKEKLTKPLHPFTSS